MKALLTIAVLMSSTLAHAADIQSMSCRFDSKRINIVFVVDEKSSSNVTVGSDNGSIETDTAGVEAKFGENDDGYTAEFELNGKATLAQFQLIMDGGSGVSDVVFKQGKTKETVYCNTNRNYHPNIEL